MVLGFQPFIKFSDFRLFLIFNLLLFPFVDFLKICPILRLELFFVLEQFIVLCSKIIVVFNFGNLTRGKKIILFILPCCKRRLDIADCLFFCLGFCFSGRFSITNSFLISPLLFFGKILLILIDFLFCIPTLLG